MSQAESMAREGVFLCTSFPGAQAEALRAEGSALRAEASAQERGASRWQQMYQELQAETSELRKQLTGFESQRAQLAELGTIQAARCARCFRLTVVIRGCSNLFRSLVVHPGARRVRVQKHSLSPLTALCVDTAWRRKKW